MTEPANRASCVVVLITAPDASCAERIATALVDERLAACVSTIGPLRSRFRWEGRIDVAAEELLLAKTAGDRVAALIERVRALHPYQVPEILALPVAALCERYLDWVIGETSVAPPPDRAP
jgi:periplasmic divalent cation tolerance protein